MLKLTIQVKGESQQRIETLARKCELSPETYVQQVLDVWLWEHRPGRGDPDRHDARNPDPLYDEEL